MANHARGARMRGVALALFTLAIWLTPTAAMALTVLSQGFTTSDNVSQGSLVSLQKDAADHVSAANSENADNVFGVVINDTSSLLSLTSDKEKQVQVATNGLVQVLVSDINGGIKSGDQITASPISGVGMKATSNAKVIGVAQDALTNKFGKKQTYEDKDKSKHDVLVGQIPVLVSVSYFYKTPEKTIIPTALQNVANALAGKPVNTTPILLSTGVFIVTLIVVASLVYAMIRNSIISMGRNPMSQAAIYRGLIQMSALVIGILAVSVVSIYLILTRL